MSKYVYAECYYPDSMNLVFSIEAESIDEAREKIIQKYKEDLLTEDDDTLIEDWHDFLEVMNEIYETIISDPINIKEL